MISKFGGGDFVVITCHLRSHSFCLLFISIPLLLTGFQVPAAKVSLQCTLQTSHPECTPLPVIRKAALHLTASNFELNAKYEACHSIRQVHIKGRALQAVSVDDTQEYELFGEAYQPVTDFIPFPRTIAYIILDTSTGNGTFTDMWSAQWLPRYSQPAILTLPIRCQDDLKEN